MNAPFTFRPGIREATPLLIGLVVMGVNLIVDLLYGLINPRIRHH